MNNQKQQKPTLTGQRFKTRKRGLFPLISFLALYSVTADEACIHFFFFFFSPHQMKRRDLTLLSFKKVSYKAWTKLALIWTQLQSSWMPLAPSLTTADMQRLSLTSWWLAECWVSQSLGFRCLGGNSFSCFLLWLRFKKKQKKKTPLSWLKSQCGLHLFLSLQPPVGLYLTTWPALTTASSRHKKTWRQCKLTLR